MTTRTLHFDTIPTMWPTYRRALLDRKSAILGEREIPRIEAEVAGVALKKRHIDAYHQICGIASPDGVAATYPQVLAGPLHGALLTHPDFPLPAMGVVHVRQTIRVFAPMEAGDRLNLRVWVEGHREARAGIEFDLMTEFIREGGDVVWEGVTTAIVRQPSKERAPRKPKAEPLPGARPGLTSSTIWSLPSDLGRRYSAFAGDYNPIHLTAASAKLFGFKRAIIHGMWSMARCLGELDHDIPITPMEVEVDFKRPIFLPSRVAFSASKDAEGVAFWVDSSDGRRPHLVGTCRPLG